MLFKLFILFVIFSTMSYGLDVATSKKLDEIASKLDKSNLVEYELHSIQNELKIAQYQNKFLELNNIVMNIDTDNKVLKEQVKIQKEYFNTALSEQQERYETELEQQTLIYGIAFGAVSGLAFLISFVGAKRFKTYVMKTVQNEHKNAIIEITEKLSTDKALSLRVESLVRMEIANQTNQSFEGDVS